VSKADATAQTRDPSGQPEMGGNVLESSSANVREKEPDGLPENEGFDAADQTRAPNDPRNRGDRSAFAGDSSTIVEADEDDSWQQRPRPAAVSVDTGAQLPDRPATPARELDIRGSASVTTGAVELIPGRSATTPVIDEPDGSDAISNTQAAPEEKTVSPSAAPLSPVVSNQAVESDALKPVLVRGRAANDPRLKRAAANSNNVTSSVHSPTDGTSAEAAQVSGMDKTKTAGPGEDVPEQDVVEGEKAPDPASPDSAIEAEAPPKQDLL
jgi:hypothetical protein